MRSLVPAVVAAGVLLAMAPVAPAESGNRVDRNAYSIMAPEPWLPPAYRSPRKLPDRPRAARPSPPPRIETMRPDPPTVLPNGQVVPNLPPVRRGIVPDGSRETFGDRAYRCAHQSQAFGVPANQRSTYMHGCTMR